MSNWLVESGFVGETTQYDKKILPDFRKPKSWLKSVSAFANGLGGKLIFGVADDDTLVGIENPKEVSEKISEAIKDKMDPVPQIDWQIEVVNGKTVVILEVVQGRLYREDLLPRMYSNDVDFCVVLCNLNYGTEKDEVNVIGNESFALIRFLERVKVPNIMSEHIVAVYTRVKEEKVFSRKDIMDWLGFSASSAAGRVINTMKKLDLIEHAEGRGNGKYQFRKDVEGNDSVWFD